MEILRVNSYDITLRDLAELEHYENLEEAHLHWSRGPSAEKVLVMLKRFTNWRRLTLKKKNISFGIQRPLGFHNETETNDISVRKADLGWQVIKWSPQPKVRVGAKTICDQQCIRPRVLRPRRSPREGGPVT